MPRSKKIPPIVESAEIVAAALEGFDYAIDPGDFVFFGLAALIDEDRASFDDEEFRRLIDESVREHIQENLVVRAKLSGLLRSDLSLNSKMDSNARTVAMRVIHALENSESDLRNVGALVRTYTSYLFERLQTLGSDAAQEEEARAWIDRWRKGEIVREELVAALKRLGAGAAGPAADLLFELADDRMAAEAAIAVLSSIGSSVSARILAPTVSEPMLDEDLEAKAFSALKVCWPLPRHYMLYNLQAHAHEDIPFRWFQLFLEVDELSTVDLILEELRAHGGNPDYHQDLAALFDLLQGCRDPDTENKVLGAINAPETAQAVLPLLQKFVQEYRKPDLDEPSPWSRHALSLRLNRKYVTAAKLVDSGRTEKAAQMLDEILSEDSEYPFARMLKSVREGPDLPQRGQPGTKQG